MNARTFLMGVLFPHGRSSVNMKLRKCHQKVNMGVTASSYTNKVVDET